MAKLETSKPRAGLGLDPLSDEERLLDEGTDPDMDRARSGVSFANMSQYLLPKSDTWSSCNCPKDGG
jgi:hypothetical protein